MKMRYSLLPLAMLATVASAQRVTDTRDASIRGGGGEGKCTIEVEVDGTADVEISGNRLRIRTLSGSPSTIRRFECNQAMPNNASNFRFKGIDGRGRQTLARSPGGGPAVVRIEDPDGGREGYTFDIFWSGQNGPWTGNNGGGFGGGNRPGYGNGNRPGYENGNNGNWDREINFRGRGEGYFRGRRNQNDRIYNARVTVNRRGNVEVSFDTDQNYNLTLTGRIQRIEQDRIYADMNGNRIGGVMQIDIDSRNRVRNISMRSSGFGNNSSELNWHD